MRAFRTVFFRVFVALGLVGTVGLAGCSSEPSSYPDDTQRRQGGATDPYAEDSGGLFGPSGLTLFGGQDPDAAVAPGASGVAVNSYLWRASLDTVSFMPLASADPFGGVIITDWYTSPDAPNERFKINVFILSRALRGDGIRAAVFKQVRRGDAWVDVEVDKQTVVDIENAILTRARQLRIASIQ